MALTFCLYILLNIELICESKMKPMCAKRTQEFELSLWQQSSQTTESTTNQEKSLSKKHKEFKINFVTSDFRSLKTFKERFEVLSEIGRGGQAYVKEAIDLENDQHVALKIYKKSKMSLENVN